MTAAGRNVGSWRAAGWSLAGALLLAPAVAMRFTDEVRWTAADFVFAALLIGGVGLAVELAVRKSPIGFYRAGAALAALAAVGLVWVNGAVGLIGDEGNPANLLFAAVIGTVMVGAIVSRCRPGGLARTMVSAALVQGLVCAGAIAFGLGADGRVWPWDVIGASGLFIFLWLAAAASFGRAARFSHG